jgi:hypothetical protein
MAFKKDDILGYVIGLLLSLLVFIASSIKYEQIDIAARLRAVEIQNARIIERLGILDDTLSVAKKP